MLTSKQSEMLKQMCGNRRLIVSGGEGVGKTYTAVFAAMYEAQCGSGGDSPHNVAYATPHPKYVAQRIRQIMHELPEMFPNGAEMRRTREDRYVFTFRRGHVHVYRPSTTHESYFRGWDTRDMWFINDTQEPLLGVVYRLFPGRETIILNSWPIVTLEENLDRIASHAEAARGSVDDDTVHPGPSWMEWTVNEAGAEQARRLSLRGLHPEEKSD